MRRETNINKKTIVQAVINQINGDSKPAKIETNYFTGYSSPERLTTGDDKAGFVPDLVVQYKGESSLYEVELDEDMEIDKWLLFSKVAERKNGDFYIVVPDWLKDQVKTKLSENKIVAKILYFNT